MPYEDGPYIQLACFCNMVIEDKTNTLSLIRVVDRITHMEGGSNPPEIMPAFQHNLKMVVTLKPGMARGRNTIKIVPEEPDGSAGKPISLDVYFEEERGPVVVADLNYTFSKEGMYWFDVFLGEHKITSMPLRIIYQRVITGSGS